MWVRPSATERDLDEKARDLLHQEQRAWEAWSLKRAQLVSDTYRGGSHAGLAYRLELIRLYTLRIGALKRLPQDLSRY